VYFIQKKDQGCSAFKFFKYNDSDKRFVGNFFVEVLYSSIKASHSFLFVAIIGSRSTRIKGCLY
jgi:hypothetical protein